ncbi:MAG: hypothetical protein M1826_006953 [Phylliscum demangeonii]|nr:MAG: hypothetical protein M1826_006953 [Phylliscum demangeonii]
MTLPLRHVRHHAIPPLPIQARTLLRILPLPHPHHHHHGRYASTSATATAAAPVTTTTTTTTTRRKPAPPILHLTTARTTSVPTAINAAAAAAAASHPATQPPSHKRPEFRKSQLMRQYASLLRSTPLLLVLQHNSLKANEWMAIRRELTAALRRCDDGQAAGQPRLADIVRITCLRTGIFAAALRVVEYYHPERDPTPTTYTHTLSRAAHAAATRKAVKNAHPLTPLLAGRLAVVCFPTLSTAHLQAALSVLAPSAPRFAAPSRRAFPGYHDEKVRAGVQKLLVLAARVDGAVLDLGATRRLALVEGGRDGLRAQLLALLRAVGGASLAAALQGPGRALVRTVDGRRAALEAEENEMEQKGAAPQAQESSEKAP